MRSPHFRERFLLHFSGGPQWSGLQPCMLCTFPVSACAARQAPVCGWAPLLRCGSWVSSILMGPAAGLRGAQPAGWLCTLAGVGLQGL